jgi:RNA polymerase sigma-70 factor (ECF subfamily)
MRMRDDDAADRERLELLFRLHHRAVARYAGRRTAAEHVDDVVAETFLVAWRRLNDVPADALPWLLGVARRTLATQRRSKRRRVALVERVAANVPHQHATADLETDVRLANALAGLRPRDREALTLIAWDELTPAQAAVALGEPQVTFRVRLHRARLRLRRELEHDPPAQAAAATALDEAEC